MSTSLQDAHLLTVGAVWAHYEMEERELWAEYARNPTYLNGRRYLLAEDLIRRRTERTVESLRYARERVECPV